MLAMVGIPLGIATRKGGKSAGYVIGLFLAFFCYHLSSVSADRPGQAADAAGAGGHLASGRGLRPGGLIFWRAWSGPGIAICSAASKRPLAGCSRGSSREKRASRGRSRRAAGRLPLLPQLVDTYILSNFLFYLVVLLASFVSMTLVYNFFELIGDMIRNKIPLVKMFTYLFFLTPKLIYDTLPISNPGGRAGGFRSAQQAERGDGVQGLRREPSPAGPAGIHWKRAVLRGPVPFDFYYGPERTKAGCARTARFQ